MAQLNTSDISRALIKKGFVEDVRGDHKRYYLSVPKVKVSINTKISHGSSNIGDNLIIKMAKQIKLSKKEFIDYVACAIDRENYVEILKNQGIL